MIVANVFILSIFGYLGRLYLIPSTMATQIGTEVGRFVVPARFFSAKLLSRPTEELGLKPPLHKLELRNAALILSRGIFPCEQGTGHPHPLPPYHHRSAAQAKMLRLQPQHLGKTIEPDHYAAATLYRPS